MAELYDAIRDADARGGNVIIPTFALEWARERLGFIREGMDRKQIRPSTQDFLDSPMALSATQLLRRHPGAVKASTERVIHEGKHPSGCPSCTSGLMDPSRCRSITCARAR